MLIGKAVRLIRRWYHTPPAVGQTLVEYGLLVALIAIIAIVALLFLGPIVSEIFSNVGNALNSTP